jgi:ABC-2 type transport system ATP-binding protein
MIDVQSLVKWYGPTRAVDNISFNIPAGQIVGFLGPNGAGKSTTLRMLTGYIPPTSGSASIAGHNVVTDSEGARSKIGYLPESTPLYTEMRVEEYLHYRGRLMSMPRALRNSRIDTLCDRCGLAANRRRLIGQLSKGNRQRVGLAQALLHEPQVLILDEPTAGLDPNQITEVRKLISELRGKHTIILSTHILPEVERTADRVLIIAGGRIVAQGTPDELRKSVATGARVVVELWAEPSEAANAIKAIEAVRDVETSSHEGWCRAVVTPRGNRDVREAIAKLCMTRGWVVREMRFETATLEQFFIQITATQSQSASPAA